MDRRLLAVSAWVVVLLAGVSPLVRGAPERPFDLAAAAARLDDLVVRINGSLEELRASEKLAYHRIEGGIADCMREHSRPYQKPSYVSAYQDYTDADLGWGTGRASVVDSLTAGARRAVLNEIAFARIEKAVAVPAPGDTGVLQGCTDRFGGKNYFFADLPTTNPQLLGFDELLLPVVRDPGVESAMLEYRKCMKDRYGYVVDDRDDFIVPIMDRADAPVDGSPAKPAWDRDVATMNRWFAADADCRRPAYVAGMKILAGRLDGFEERHRVELAAIRATWRQRVDDAAKLPD